MYYLIMGKDKDKLLRIRIAHTEGHLIVVVRTIKRILLHIRQEVMHPSHIPLKMEAETSFLRRFRNIWPGSRFFRNNHAAVFPFTNNRIQMLEKLNCFQVSISAKTIRKPLSVTPSVIEVKHGRHRIYSKTVNMIEFIPVKGIGNQEVLHLRLPIIKNLGSPVGMLSQPGIRMFITGLSIEIGKAMRILWKMCRYPIENDSDAGLMQNVHHFHKVLRTAVTGGRRIVACHLIPPGSVKGVLCNAH